MDIRPVAKDISLCTNKYCKDKCKRYYENWQVGSMQSYINPNMQFDENGILKECSIRMEWEEK